MVYRGIHSPVGSRRGCIVARRAGVVGNESPEHNEARPSKQKNSFPKVYYSRLSICCGELAASPSS
jgi:hypothetical protein